MGNTWNDRSNMTVIFPLLKTSAAPGTAISQVINRSGLSFQINLINSTVLLLVEKLLICYTVLLDE